MSVTPDHYDLTLDAINTHVAHKALSHLFSGSLGIRK